MGIPDVEPRTPEIPGVHAPKSGTGSRILEPDFPPILVYLRWCRVRRRLGTMRRLDVRIRLGVKRRLGVGAAKRANLSL